jgi:hypothetical protein
MKRIIFILLLSPVFMAHAQELLTDHLKADTVPGHGYEVLYMGDYVLQDTLIQKYLNVMVAGKMMKIDNGYDHKKHRVFETNVYKWAQVVHIADSVYKLNQGWRIPTVNDMRFLFTFLKNRESLSSPWDSYRLIDSQGDTFWCYDKPVIIPNAWLLIFSVSFDNYNIRINHAFDFAGSYAETEKHCIMFIRKY